MSVKLSRSWQIHFQVFFLATLRRLCSATEPLYVWHLNGRALTPPLNSILNSLEIADAFITHFRDSHDRPRQPTMSKKRFVEAREFALFV
jgi:hypothetical protein